jgi:hypothetical protein
MEISKKLIIHPFLFGIFPIIALYESSMNFIPVLEIVLPICITLGIVIPLFFILKKIQNSQKSALMISFSLILFFIYAPIFSVLDNVTITGFDLGRHYYLLIPFIGFFSIGISFLIKTKKNLKNLTNFANIISLIIIVVLLANITVFSLENNRSVNINNVEFDFKNNEIKSLPDIYFIILDGYPGNESLKTVNNYDNQEFLNNLKNHGFSIHEKSYANYAHTYLSLPSILNMKYLHSLVDEHGSKNDQLFLHAIGSNNEVMTFAKSIGYETISLDSGWGFTSDMKTADLKLCNNNKIFGSEFLVSWIKNSMLSIIYVNIFGTGQLEQRLCILEELPTIKKYTDEPKFVFAHLFMPHPPYFFGPNGEIRSLENIDPNLETKDNLNKDAFMDQLEFLNKKVIEIVEQLLDTEKQPIIIIISDHGTAFLLDDDPKNWITPTDEMIKERMDTITFIFLPDKVENIFLEIKTPVNIFRILFNHYFETNYEILEERMYFANDQSYDFLNVTELLNKP